MAVRIDELRVADEPAAWERLGFAVGGSECRVGGIRIRLEGPLDGEGAAAGGLLGWSLAGAAGTELDGLATELSTRPPDEPAPAHPNGALAIDHVVAITPALQRTVAVLRAAGLDLRRIREEPTPAGAPRQAFFRLGEAILEVVQEPESAVAAGGGPDRPAIFWGVALLVADLDAAVARLGPELVSGPRPAVQPGRRIATLRRAAGLSLPVALMTPRPRREPAGAG